MTNLSYGQNVVYFLNDLAASEVSDITSGEFESYGEDGQGRDASCSIDITLLAADAVSMISALQEQVQKLAAENAAMKQLAMDYANLADSRLSEITANCESDCRRECYEECNKIPATGAVIREIGAKALDKLSEECDGYPKNHVYTHTKCHAEEFAARLRAGEVS